MLKRVLCHAVLSDKKRCRADLRVPCTVRTPFVVPYSIRLRQRRVLFPPTTGRQQAVDGQTQSPSARRHWDSYLGSFVGSQSSSLDSLSPLSQTVRWQLPLSGVATVMTADRSGGQRRPRVYSQIHLRPLHLHLCLSSFSRTRRLSLILCDTVSGYLIQYHKRSNRQVWESVNHLRPPTGS